MIFDREAKIKLSVFKDSTRSRGKIAEIVSSYRNDQNVAKLLKGLRFMAVPGDFDADSESDRKWAHSHLKTSCTKDILFQIIFGNFTKSDFEVFSDHNGPMGLKYAILHEIIENGLTHGPTFRKNFSYDSSGPIRECIAMLKGIGMIKSPRQSLLCFPTIKGRLLLDLSRKFYTDFLNCEFWSFEFQQIFEALDIQLPSIRELKGYAAKPHIEKNIFDGMIIHIESCKSSFGRNLSTKSDSSNLAFYRNDFVASVQKRFLPEFGQQDFFIDESSLLFYEDFL